MARLVAPAGCAQRPPARFPGTAIGAVQLAAIAMPADEHLYPAAQAQEEPGRRSVAMVGTTDGPWTRSGPSAIMPLHSCARTVSGTAPILTAKFCVGAVPAYQARQGLIGPADWQS